MCENKIGSSTILELIESFGEKALTPEERARLQLQSPDSICRFVDSVPSEYLGYLLGVFTGD